MSIAALLGGYVGEHGFIQKDSGNTPPGVSDPLDGYFSPGVGGGEQFSDSFQPELRRLTQLRRAARSLLDARPVIMRAISTSFVLGAAARLRRSPVNILMTDDN